MCRCVKKYLLILVACCGVSIIPSVLDKLNGTSRAAAHLLNRRVGPPVFQISDSKSHTFMFKERYFSVDSSKNNEKQPDENRNKQHVSANSTSQEIKHHKHSENARKSGREARARAATEADSPASPNVTNWCPDKPPFLVGALAGLHQDIPPERLLQLYPQVENGGRHRPKDCVPRQRLAIIIPYRNRYPHLHIMLNNLMPVLQRQQADVTFFVIEQALPEMFNRGALLNVGFLEAEKLASFDCYIFHDVDMIPLNDHNLYRCGDNPRHFAVAMNKLGYKPYYNNYFGAVVGFSKSQFLKVNGCSNIYFGWGGEDDDLLTRLRSQNYTMVRYDLNTGRYDMIKHKRDRGNEENLLRRALRNNARARQAVEGLNTLRYQVNSVRQERLYTWITVTLNRTEILETAPKRTLEIMKVEMMKLEKSKKQAQSKTQSSTSPAAS
jgi:hypothetical protein